MTVAATRAPESRLLPTRGALRGEQAEAERFITKYGSRQQTLQLVFRAMNPHSQRVFIQAMADSHLGLRQIFDITLQQQNSGRCGEMMQSAIQQTGQLAPLEIRGDI